MRAWWLPVCVSISCASGPEPPDRFEPPKTTMLYRKPDCPSPTTKRPYRTIRHRSKPPTLAGASQVGIIAVTHGGVGSANEDADGPGGAAQAAYQKMVQGGSALEAAIVGTKHLEDDPRFNAGTGANIRLDGQTIQMDASLMTSEGAFAAVAVIERVKNPIAVARLVLDSPHVLLAGVGATRFAHKLGIADEVPTCPEAEERYTRRMKRMKQLSRRPGGIGYDWQMYWNFPSEMPPEVREWRKGGDTVGSVTRDEDGRFAATLSTGGTSVTLYGRVGDVPIYGAGLYAGPEGAVACTGVGEEIIRQALARSVYERIASGIPARDAVQALVLDFPPDMAVGLIAVDKIGWGVAANRSMAFGMANETE